MTYLERFTESCEAAFRTKNHPEYLGLDRTTHDALKDELLNSTWVGLYHVGNTGKVLGIVDPVTRELVPLDVWDTDELLFIFIAKPYKEQAL